MYFIAVDRCHGRALICGKLERHTGTGVYVTASGAGITRIRVQFSSISLVAVGTRCPPALLVSAFRLQPSPCPPPPHTPHFPSFPFPGNSLLPARMQIRCRSQIITARFESYPGNRDNLGPYAEEIHGAHAESSVSNRYN